MAWTRLFVLPSSKHQNCCLVIFFQWAPAGPQYSHGKKLKKKGGAVKRPAKVEKRRADDSKHVSLFANGLLFLVTCCAADLFLLFV